MYNSIAEDMNCFQESTSQRRIITPTSESDMEDVAFKMGVVGVGKCGSKLGLKYGDMGYPLLVVNSSSVDLKKLAIPEDNKLAIGEKGAGKNPDDGYNMAYRSRTLIRAQMAYIFEKKVKKIMVCMSGDGGTGGGAGPLVVEIAQDLIREWGGDPKKDVIAKMALPKPVAGANHCRNALLTYGKLEALAIPRIYIDNSVMTNIFKKKADDYWGPLNYYAAKTFHRFNTYADKPTDLSSFDASELETVLSQGRIMYTAFQIDDIENQFALGTKLATMLTNSLFAKADITTAKVGAILTLINARKCDENTVDKLDAAYEYLNSIGLKCLFHGNFLEKYDDDPDNEAPLLFMFVMLGGMDHPYDSLMPLFEQCKHLDPSRATLDAYINPRA